MSNLQNKQINISPELLNIKPKVMKNKTLKKQKPISNLQSNKLKKNLLTKIKNYKQNKEININENNNKNDTENIEHTPSESIQKHLPILSFKKSILKKNIIDNPLLNQDDDYSESINYLQSLSLKKNNKIPDKSQNILPGNLEENLEEKLSLEKSDQPKYGCLKNGALPTYKEWKNKTLKKPTIEINTDNNIEYNDEYNDKHNKSKNQTLKYYLGKRGRKVSILVKNSATRKKITNEHNLIKQESIFKMKTYLKKHNLLKSGSHAPPNVIKKMYEQAILSGDIQNSNKDSIIHNYLAE